MQKKFLTFLSLAIILISQPAFSNAQSTTSSGTQEEKEQITCTDLRDLAIEICNDCRQLGRNSKATLVPYFNEKDREPYLKFFTKSEYECSKIIPLTTNQQTDSLFISSNINCSNIEETICETGPSNSPLQQIKLTPSDSEFFNVLDPNTGLIANSSQGTSFQNAVKENGPILGPILLIINFLTAIIATLAILALVIGGFFMITARGEESQITRGKDIVKNSLLAIVIVLGSYALIRTVQATILLILN